MILTVDIGNSNIVVGLWENEALIHIGRILTKKDYTVKELIFSLKEQSLKIFIKIHFRMLSMDQYIISLSTQ